MSAKRAETTQAALCYRRGQAWLGAVDDDPSAMGGSGFLPDPGSNQTRGGGFFAPNSNGLGIWGGLLLRAMV